MKLYKDYEGKGFSLDVADLLSGYSPKDSFAKRLSEATLSKSELLQTARELDSQSKTISRIVREHNEPTPSIFSSKRMSDATIEQLQREISNPLFDSVLYSGKKRDALAFSASLDRCVQKLDIAIQKDIPLSMKDINGFIERDLRARTTDTLYGNIKSVVSEVANTEYGKKAISVAGVTAVTMLTLSTLNFESPTGNLTKDGLTPEERYERLVELYNLSNTNFSPAPTSAANFVFNESDPMVIMPKGYSGLGGKTSSFVFKSPTNPNENLFTLGITTSNVLGGKENFSVAVTNLHDVFGSKKSEVSGYLQKIFVDGFYKNSVADSNVYDKLDNFKFYAADKMEILGSAKSMPEFVSAARALANEITMDNEIKNVKLPEKEMKSPAKKSHSISELGM